MKEGRRVADRVRRFEEWILTSLLLGMASLAFMQILLRNLFGTGLVWADPLLRQMLLWLALTGAVVATGEGRDIAVDALRRLLPDRLRGWVDLFVHAFSGGVGVLLTCATFMVFYGEFMAGHGGDVAPGLPLWASLLTMPVAFLLITIRSFLSFLRALQSLTGSKG